MIMYKILERDFSTELVNSTKLEIVKDLSEVNDNEPMLMGGDILRDDVRLRLRLQRPTIFIHRGYLGNHLYKTRKWWRYSVNSFANTKITLIPHPRWHLLGLQKHPWKVSAIKKVLIAPSKLTSKIWSPAQGNNWAASMLSQFPGAEVRIRPKGSTPGVRWSTLWEDLNWADLVVSQASAITAEAFWYGKKVISLFPCPSWAAGSESTLDHWQDPTEPTGRDLWHEHLAWSQFTNSEWQSGEAFELIEQYIGNIQTYDPGYNYNFI